MRIAILDDYQNVAKDMADWSNLQRDHEVTFFHDIYEGVDGFAERLQGYDVLGVMRERSPIKRDLLEKLPDVKLLATAGMRNAAIDLDYCRERGIAVAGGDVEYLAAGAQVDCFAELFADDLQRGSNDRVVARGPGTLLLGFNCFEGWGCRCGLGGG